VLNVFGQTELNVVTMGVDHGHLGIIAPGITVEVLNPDTREPCPPDVHGELCVRTTTCMLGYFRQPEKTKKEFFVEERRLAATGDLVYYNKNGKLFYVDRIKELITTMSYHISPTELEMIASSHPAVDDVMIFGYPDVNVQQIVTMVVVLAQGYDVLEAVFTRLSNFKCCGL